jgi:hypothetical protein
MSAKRAEDIHLWFCPDCVKNKGRKSILKTRCASSLFAEMMKKKQMDIHEAHRILQMKESTALMPVDISLDFPQPIIEIAHESNKENISLPTVTEEISPTNTNDPSANDIGISDCISPARSTKISTTNDETPVNIENEQNEQSQIDTKICDEYPYPDFVLPTTCKKYLPPHHIVDPNRTTISGGPNTKYCSDECGESLALYLLKDSIKFGRVPFKSEVNDSVSKEEWKEAVDSLKRLDAVRVEQMERLFLEWRIIKGRIRALERRRDLIWGAVLRAGRGSDDADYGNYRDDGEADEVEKSIDICGFDSRILKEWVVPAGDKWTKLAVTSMLECGGYESVNRPSKSDAVAMSLELHDAEHQTKSELCIKSPHECKEHEDWSVMRIEEVQLEIEQEVSTDFFENSRIDIIFEFFFS